MLLTPVEKMVDSSFRMGVRSIGKRKTLMEVIFLEDLKEIVVAYRDRFTHFSTWACIRR